MKVGILTFHNAVNYGAVLQTYATQELVKQYGHDVEVIDYHNKAVDSFYDEKKFHFKAMLKAMLERHIKSLLIYLITKAFNWKRNNAYKNFGKKYLHLSARKYIQGEPIVLLGYDVILIGSDQLWNRDITHGFDHVYWGDFKTSPDSRKVAWSVCMNKTNIGLEDEEYIKAHLNLFHSISVREKPLQVFLHDLTGKTFPHTLDPTLLLSIEKWSKLCHPVKGNGYIAVYAVCKEDKAIAFAKNFAAKQQKKLIVIRSYSKHFISSENIESGGPVDFLSYLLYADYVVTTSFHGTVFSIIFQKQFICPIFEENVRIESLLASLGIKQRMVHSIAEADGLPPINYVIVNKKKSKLEKETHAFLSSILS